MKLPILVSIPHAGLHIPEEAKQYCALSERDIAEDGDIGAMEAYYALWGKAQEFVTTNVARAIVDLNRAEDDRSKDGVVKTHTCWNVPVYRTTPPEHVLQRLIVRYHRPFHHRLTDLARRVRLGLDCHTMAAKGPPVALDADQKRPAVCLSNGEGATCTDAWLDSLAAKLQVHFPEGVSVNSPFKGGYICRRHSPEVPWMQLELSRDPFYSFAEKGERILAALTAWWQGLEEDVGPADGD